MEEVYTNCYGSLSVYKNKNDALKFYNECYLLSEGAERERYASILFALNNNESIAYDNFSNTCGEIYLHTNNYFERPLKIDLDSMLSFKDCIKYYKDSLKPLLEVCNEFEINFNNNSPFEEFGADNEFNMRSITDFYIELLKKKKINFDNITTNEVSDGKYELVIDNNFVLDTRAWDDFNSVIDNVNSIEEYSKKMESEKEYE